MVSSQAPKPNIFIPHRFFMHLSHLSPKKSSRKDLPMTTIKKAISDATSLLRYVGIKSAEIDARLLMEQTLDMNFLEIIINDRELSDYELKLFYELLSRRLAFEPMAYIQGKKEFYGYEFYVNNHCLIPRPDTEILVEHCLRLLSNKKTATIFDIGTGTGAIALSLVKEHKGVNAYASDCSLSALDVAKKNAAHLLVSDRLSFLHGDLFDPFNKDMAADLIVSNPPYISARDYEDLPPDIRHYEPKNALTPGDEEGLIMYERLLDEGASYLKDGGFLVLEIGFDQAEQIMKLADARWQKEGLYKDLAGNWRVISFKKIV